MSRRSAHRLRHFLRGVTDNRTGSNVDLCQTRLTLARLNQPRSPMSTSNAPQSIPLTSSNSTNAPRQLPADEKHKIDFIPPAQIQNQTSSAMAPSATKSIIESALPYVVLTWCVGVAIMSIWNVGGWLTVQRLKHRAIQPVDESLSQRAAKLAQRAGTHPPYPSPPIQPD